jgi:archaellum component FlaC
MQTREEYQAQAAAKLEELRINVWMVKQKADEMTDETKAEYHLLFQALNEKSEEVGERLRELEEASDETWRDVKAKVDGAMSDLNNSVGNALSRMG